MFELTQIMRQGDDVDFANLLNRLREGNQTSDDIKLLQTRCFSQTSSEYQSAFNYPHLFLKNDKVDDFNSQCFENANSYKLSIMAADKVIEDVSPEIRDKVLSKIPNNPRKTYQLFTKLDVAENLHFDVTSNVDTNDGLTNGAECVVKKISVKQNAQADGIIWGEFDSVDIGQNTRRRFKQLYRQSPHIDKSWTPILPQNKKLLIGGKFEVTRRQFPIRPSSAKTIHLSLIHI